MQRKMVRTFVIKKYTKPLQLMESLKEEFQIFFLDIEMPAMDGMELVDIIRRHDEKSIILYVSSHNEFLGVGYKYDVQNFITKPSCSILLPYFSAIVAFHVTPCH